MKDINEQLSNRAESKIKSNYKSYKGLKSNDYSHLICTSSCDRGVQRNGGRLGARFAPKTILYELGKLETPSKMKPIFISEVCSPNKEESFKELQELQFKKITKVLNDNYRKIVQIGGGHDHIFPFLRAMEKSEPEQKLIIINIDAHTDTRNDELPHSGTPFRQFGETSRCEFDLIQLGVRSATNNKNNYLPLKNGQMHCLSFHTQKDIVEAKKLIESLKSEKTTMILSIDCDGIDQTDLPAVSAPNPFGTPFPMLLEFINAIKDDVKYLGVYELNPLLESHSNHSSKKIAWLLYNYLV